jgi:phage tail-like protein
MTKLDPNFAHDIFTFLHKPLRDGDKETFNFLERFLFGPQTLWEEKIHSKLLTINDLIDPAKTSQPRLLKDHVGFTKELDSIISDISDDDLRKIISLAVALWKKKGLEVGYEDIIRVFTGANVRIFNWFDFRYIVGEQQFGEQQLGEDSWFISEPGVLGSEDEVNEVVGLFPFENTFTDRSPIRNPGIKSGEAVFFNNGPTDGSLKYVQFGQPGVELPQASEVTRIDVSGSTPAGIDGTWFQMYDTAGTVGFWFDVDDSGTSEPAGSAAADRSIEINTINTGDSDSDIATKIAAAMDADAQYSAVVENSTEVVAEDAVSEPRSDASSETSGFTISIDRQGAATAAEALPRDGFMFVRDSILYDFSGSFTIELFIKTSIDQDIFGALNDGYIFSKADPSTGKEISIQYLTSTDQIVVTLDDGTNNVSFTLNSGLDLDDGGFRHLALTINKDDANPANHEARLWFNGSEATAIEDISTIGDLTNNGQIFLSTQDLSGGYLKASFDNFRISLNTVYNTSGAVIPVPANSFIEFIEPALDEFFSDIRVQDDGTGSLNRILLKRIINLMRPTSERLNLIFVRLADDFRQGKGNFVTLTGSSEVNVDLEMIMQPETFEIVDVVNADSFKDTYFQASLRIADINMTGSLVFNYQDPNNYYIFKMITGSREFALSKVVSGIETSLAPNVIADIEENTDYILTLTTFKDPFSTDVKIICYQDRNVIFDVVDQEFATGRFGFKTEAGSIMTVNEVEMFEQPLETDLIVPGFSG